MFCRVEMYNLVKVGVRELIGEVVKVNGVIATVHMFEDTRGLSFGDPVLITEDPMTAELGPGLLGNAFDALQRSISNPISVSSQKWWFKPLNYRVNDIITGGDIYGVVIEGEGFEHFISLPVEERGAIVWIASAGQYGRSEKLLGVELNGIVKQYTMWQRWQIRKNRPTLDKLQEYRPLATGTRIIDTLFPLAYGGSSGLIGPHGSGKSMLCREITKRRDDSEVMVLVLCGCNGSDTTQLLRVASNTVIVSGGNNLSQASIEASIHLGATIAEYFRDMGKHAILLVDSLSSWNYSSRVLEETISETPFTASDHKKQISSRLSRLYGRAGNYHCIGNPARKGSLTIVGTLCESGALTDPISLSLIQSSQTLWVLDNNLVQRGIFPAMNILSSFSKYIKCAQQTYNEIEKRYDQLRVALMKVLDEGQRLYDAIIHVGKDSLNEREKSTFEVSQLILQHYLSQDYYSEHDKFCSISKSLYILKNWIHFYELSQRHICEYTLTWSSVASERSELLDKLSTQQNGNATQEEYQALNEEITTSFKN